MRRIFILALLLFLISAPIGVSSPIGGPFATGEVPIAPRDSWKAQKKFRGGERACVIAIATDVADNAQLKIAIYDNTGALVVEGKGSNLVGDFVAAIWYPPRDGDYRIEVSNLGNDASKCSITVK